MWAAAFVFAAGFCLVLLFFLCYDLATARWIDVPLDLIVLAGLAFATRKARRQFARSR